MENRFPDKISSGESPGFPGRLTAARATSRASKSRRMFGRARAHRWVGFRGFKMLYSKPRKLSASVFQKTFERGRFPPKPQRWEKDAGVRICGRSAMTLPERKVAQGGASETAVTS